MINLTRYFIFILVCVLCFSGCTSTFYLIDNGPKAKTYEKPLFVISYDKYTESLQKELESAFIKVFDKQNYDVSTVRIPHSNKQPEIVKNQFSVQDELKAPIPVNNSDLIVLIRPVSIVMQEPGTLYAKVYYQIFCIDSSNNRLVWRTKYVSRRYLSKKIDVDRMANQIVNQLIENKVIHNLVLDQLI